MFDRIDNWNSERSDWVIESTDGEYVNVSIYSPLSGSLYIELPDKKLKKGLINIKNYDNMCFLWFYIRHLNSLKTHPKRITKVDRQMVNGLDYSGIKFSASKKDCSKIGRRITSVLMCLVMKMVWFIQFMY